jgi:hypothetical protein
MGVKVTSKDLYNMKQRARNAQLGGLTGLYNTLHGETLKGFAAQVVGHV